MPQVVPHLRSHWLMLSSVLPDAGGSDSQRLAWQLLEQTCRQHSVSLACRVGGPIHVSQWQKLQAMTCRLAVEPTSGWDRPMRWLRMGWRWSVVKQVLGRDIETVLKQWDAQQRIETVLVTDARLLDAAVFFKTRRQIIGGLTIASFESMPIPFSPARWPGRLAA